MFEALGRAVVRRRRLVLALFVVGLVVAGILGSRLFSRLAAGGFDDPGSDSAATAHRLDTAFGVRDPVAVLAVRTPTGVDEDARPAIALVRRLGGENGVARVVSYWTSGRPGALKGADGRTGEVLVYSDSSDDKTRSDLGERIVSVYDGTNGGLRVFVGGTEPINSAINSAVKSDLRRAESIAIPLTIVMLIFVFGSVVSAGLPFLVAAGATFGTFFVLFLVSLATDVSVFALNLITGLGLGLGIDYALLVVNRFREELARGVDTETAVVRTVATAGRTVFFSGLTVTITLASLLVFPQYFLRSFGYAGISVTLLAVTSTVVALPAVLTLLGGRVNRLKVMRRNLTPRDTGLWATIARSVMRFRWLTAVLVLGALIFVAWPAHNVTFGQVSDRALPKSNRAAVAAELLRDEFPGREATPVDVVVPGGASPAVLADYPQRLSRVPGVVRVITPTSIIANGAAVAPNPSAQGFTAGSDARLSVIADVDPRSPTGQRFTEHIRAAAAPPGTLVGGAAAEYTDSQAGIADQLWVVLTWIAVTSFVVLFLFTGSLVLPIKAILLNILSLSATLGVIVWVFQDGHLRSVVGDFTITGTIDTSMVVLIATLAFALSMDYEVFLLSRIKEEHDAGLNTEAAVVLGLQRSGRIITAAAALLTIIFAAFVSSSVTNIKQLGVGVAFAILVDATIVRALFVPAIMRILGNANWWAPRPLRALHARIGLSEGETGKAPVPVAMEVSGNVPDAKSLATEYPSPEES
jgi:putative drug exporter of the RND superfamily